jgi:hypothetical protein
MPQHHCLRGVETQGTAAEVSCGVHAPHLVAPRRGGGGSGRHVMLAGAPVLLGLVTKVGEQITSSDELLLPTHMPVTTVSFARP